LKKTAKRFVNCFPRHFEGFAIGAKVEVEKICSLKKTKKVVEEKNRKQREELLIEDRRLRIDAKVEDML